MYIMFKRTQFQHVKNRLIEPRKFMQVILGPRQVGKTTLIKQLLNEIEIPSHYVSADAVAIDNLWIEQQWETARIIKKQKEANEFIFVIDEVQKLTNWSEQVKAQWDKDSFYSNNIKVVLLGSASLLLQKGLSESLAGRYETTKLMHWSFSEMSSAFGFTPEQYVWFGGYPGAASLSNDESRWKKYVLDALIEPTIMKDVLMLARVDKPALLKKMFELACSYSGQIVSFNKILGQLQDAGNTTTLSHYLNLLDDAALISGINKLYKEKVRQKASIPKYQVYNTALLSVQKNTTFNEIQLYPEEWGRHVESTVGSHLINYARREKFDVYYWRHRNNEIDFVIENGRKIIGLEIKSGRKQFSKGFKEFKNSFPDSKILLIGASGLPWQEFLMINPVDLF